MHLQTIKTVLAHIRDNYLRIRQLTETLDADTSPATYQKIVQQRAALLSEIKDKQHYLETIHPQWYTQYKEDQGLATLKSELQLLIAAILALDSMLQDTIVNRMADIQTDITNLSENSKVALSYTRHTV